MMPSLHAFSQPLSLPEYKRWLDLSVTATYTACSNGRILSCVETMGQIRVETPCPDMCMCHCKESRVIDRHHGPS